MAKGDLRTATDDFLMIEEPPPLPMREPNPSPSPNPCLWVGEDWKAKERFLGPWGVLGSPPGKLLVVRWLLGEATLAAPTGGV